MNPIRPCILAKAAALLLLAAAALSAQAPTPTPADSALRACAAAAQAKDEATTKAAAAQAERLFRARIAADPRDADARVGMAQTISQCRIPLANFMNQGQLVGESNELLEAALAIDSTHWTARFVLGMNHYYTPAFLGRTGDAIAAFEHLVAQQGNRNDQPRFAEPYLRLGDLYLRSGRKADAVSVWRKGLALFPAHEGLRKRLTDNGEQVGVNRTGVSAPVPASRSAVAVEGLVVRASGIRMDETRGGTSLRRLDVLTTPGGAADVMQAFQTVPGTTRAGEGSDLYVRGGDPAEAPVFVDGARLFYPGRYESLNGSMFGILDSNVIRSAYFSSGGFSARYGDALSGVLDVETEGRPLTRMRQLNLNTVQAGAIYRTPIGEHAGAWTTLRASDAALMLAMHGRGDEFTSAPWALEGMAGGAWEPRKGTRLRATALVDGDASARDVEAYGYHGSFHSGGRNRLLGLSGKTTRADGRAAIGANLSLGERTTGFRFGVLDRERTDRGARARVDGDLAWGVGGRVRMGVEGALLDAREEGVVPTTAQLGPGSPTRALEDSVVTASHLGGYVEGERALASGVAVVAGVRADRLPGEDGWSLDPRASLAVSRGEWTLRLGGGEFHQGRWRIRYQVPDAGSPSGTPRVARHLVAGAEHRGEPSVRVEAYAKSYGDYVPAGSGPRIAAGRAAGVDAIVRWAKQEHLNGWITYSYLHGTVDLEDGRVVPSAVDVPHTLTGVAKLAVGRSWEVGSTLRYGTGRPFTPVVGSRAAADGTYSPVYGPTFSERLPDYLRLDGRVTRFVRPSTGSGVVYLEMLNLLDRDNVSAYTYDATYRERRGVPSFFSQRTLVLGMGFTFK